MNDFSLSKSSLSNLEGVEDRGKILVKMALSLSPIDFGIPLLGGHRTNEEQNILFKKGVSQKDGYENKSMHQLRKAIDFIPYVKGKYTYSHHYYLIIIGCFFAAAKSLRMDITSGLDWDGDGEFITDQKFQDYAHIQWK